MSWAYPQYKPTTSWVLDSERFNENLSEYAQETDGKLNEQNFDRVTLDEMVNVNQAGVSADLALKFWRVGTKLIDPTGTIPKTPFTSDWSPIASSTQLFYAPAGKIFVAISFQYANAGAFSGVSAPGSVFAIELDGAVQMSSIVGAADISNEYTFVETDASADILYDSTPSFRAVFEPKCVTGVFQISQGLHQVRGVYRSLPSYAIAASIHGFGTVETNIVWGWA